MIGLLIISGFFLLINKLNFSLLISCFDHHEGFNNKLVKLFSRLFLFENYATTTLKSRNEAEICVLYTSIHMAKVNFASKEVFVPCHVTSHIGWRRETKHSL